MKLDHLIPRRRARVEMIPLIDCVFVLLVVFVYSMLAMEIRRGLVVELPTASALEAGPDEPVVVTLTAAGAVSVDRQPVPVDEVGLAVAARLREPGLSGVVVNAEGTALHESVIRVFDELRAQGISEVMIGAEEERP